MSIENFLERIAIAAEILANHQGSSLVPSLAQVAVAAPVAESPAPRKTRTRAAPESPPPVTQATTSAAPAAAAPPTGATLPASFQKEMTDQILAVAGGDKTKGLGKDVAKAVLAKYFIAGSQTPVTRCGDLPKEHWVAVKAEAEALLAQATESAANESLV